MDVEQRARELLAAEFGCDLVELSESEVRAAQVILAWQGAFTPPEGYVLVPVELLRMVIGCAYPVSTDINQRGYAWSEAYFDQVLPSVKAALAAARPEVRP